MPRLCWSLSTIIQHQSYVLPTAQRLPSGQQIFEPRHSPYSMQSISVEASACTPQEGVNDNNKDQESTRNSPRYIGPVANVKLLQGWRLVGTLSR